MIHQAFALLEAFHAKHREYKVRYVSLDVTRSHSSCSHLVLAYQKMGEEVKGNSSFELVYIVVMDLNREKQAEM